MNNPKLSLHTLRLIWLLVLATDISFCVSCSAEEKEKKVTFQRENGGGLMLFDTPFGKFASRQPVQLRQSRSATGMPSLSFTHTGYSAMDPDGKSANLALTLQTAEVPATEQEIQAVIAKGYTLSDKFQVSVTWELNVSLAENDIEEARIRKSLSLPAKLDVIGTTIPIQLAWSEVKGADVYRWLTDQETGLRVYISGRAKCSIAIPQILSLDDTKAKEWWKEISADSDSIIWEGEIDELLTSMIFADCFKLNGKPISVLEANFFMDLLRSVIPKFATITPTQKTVAKAQILDSATWALSKDATFSFPSSITSEIRPGDLLNSNPNAIKDLTSGAKGLDILNKDN